MAWGTASGEHFLASNPPLGSTVTWDSGTKVADQGGEVFNLLNAKYGYRPDSKIVTDAAITNGQNILTSASANFTAADVVAPNGLNKRIVVVGDGAAGADLDTTISGFTNSTTVTLAANASTAVSGASAEYGTNNAPAITAAMADAVAAGPGSVIWIPTGRAIARNLSSASMLVNGAGITVTGAGYASVLRIMGTNANAMIQVTAARCAIEKIRLVPGASAYSGIPIQFTGAPDGVVDRVIVDGSAALCNYGNAIQFDTGSDRGRTRFCDLLNNNGATARGNMGVEVNDSSDVLIFGCYINGARQYGIDVRSTTDLSPGCRIIGNLITATTSSGMELWQSRLKVYCNEIRGLVSHNGILITGDPGGCSAGGNQGSILCGNTLSGGCGIDAEWNLGGLIVVANTITAAVIPGIAFIRLVTDSVIADNTIIGCTEPTYGSITVHFFSGGPSARISVTGNVVRNSTNFGIYMEDGAGSKVADNIVSGCATGFTASNTNATALSVHDNDFLNNTTPVTWTPDGASRCWHNAGLNPWGNVTTPGFPLTTVAVANNTAVDVDAYITNGTSVMTLLITGRKGNVTITIPASALVQVRLPAGESYTPTYAGGAPGHVWYGE